MSTRWLPLAALAMACTAPHPTGAPAGDAGAAPGRIARPIVDGTLDAGDPAVVAIGPRRVGCEDQLAARCTGTVVAPRLVLTAAHCVVDPRLSSDLEVMLGAAVDAPEATFRRVVQVAAHPDYRAEGDEADIAVLVLDAPVAVTPAALPATTVDTTLVGQRVRVVGFGATSPTGEPPGRKRTGTATVTELAARWFRIEADPSMSCHGDSGGPVLGTLAGAADGEVLLGVVSRGDPGCRDYGINVRVDAFARDFIEPWIAMASAPDAGVDAGMDAPAAIAEDALCTAPCAADADCPDELVCQPGLAGDSRCVVPGLLAGTLGDACQGDFACSDRCVRVRPDDQAGACRCHIPCTDTPMLPNGDSGCRAAPSGPGHMGRIFLILLLTLVLHSRRNQGNPYSR